MTKQKSEETIIEQEQEEEIIFIKNENCLQLRIPLNQLKSEHSQREHSFNFDYIYDQNATQANVFQELQQIIQSSIDGYNICIFAYGQTGSGKTYTMVGDPYFNENDNINENEGIGIAYRSVLFIFREIKKLQEFGWNYEIQAKFLEIYNEQIRCLISNTNIVQTVKISTTEQLFKLLKAAFKNRKTSETTMNEHSSRSHFIFQLQLIGTFTPIQQQQQQNQQQQQSPKHFNLKEIRGSINIIDLAGSERLSESKVEGERLKETKHINKSLSALGDVISAMANNHDHKPYRNSELTLYLKDYLGGNSKTLMLVNISNSCSDLTQSLQSLRFAVQVNACQNHKIQKNCTKLLQTSAVKNKK